MRVRDLAKSRQVSDQELVSSLPELLEGSAIKWWRVQTRFAPFTSFDEFTRMFLADFQPFNLHQSRLDIIRKRLQKPEESIVNYIAFMRNEFLCFFIFLIFLFSQFLNFLNFPTGQKKRSK